MTATLALALSLASLALAGALLLKARDARDARRELSQRLHDQALALDQRCDALQYQLDHEILHRRIDHLMDLVAVSERQGSLEAEVADRLQGFVLALRDEAHSQRG